MSPRLGVVCWLLALCGLAAGQGVCADEPVPEDSPWRYRAYQTPDGLPDNSITGVAQAPDGYLWVATKAGALSFNGERFAMVPSAALPPLPSRSVRAMLCDRQGRLWLAMERGPVLCLKPDGLASFTTQEGLPTGRVLRLAEDSEGFLWVAYPNQLRRIGAGRVQEVNLPPDWPTGVDNLLAVDGRGEIWCAKGTQVGVWRDGHWQARLRLDAPVVAMAAARRGTLWLAAGGRLWAWTEGREPEARADIPSRGRPVVLAEDSAGALWAGTTAAGLRRWDGREWETVPTSHLEITCLHEDREGNLWAGTDGGGLNLVRQRSVALLGTKTGLPLDSVLSVTEDREGSLWVVAQSGQMARGRPGRWELVTADTNWLGGRATCVAADRSGGVWVGTATQGLQEHRNGAWRAWQARDGLAGEGVRSLLPAANGDLWVATHSPPRLYRLRGGKMQAVTHRRPLGAVRAMAEGVDGTIWMGTADGGVHRVQELKLVPEPAIAEPAPLSVRSLLATPDGSLWIGYAGDGLGHLKGGRYRRLTTAAGLADDFISQLLSDADGQLWVAGNQGLWRVPLADLEALIAGQRPRVHARTYGGADGLPGVQPNRDCYPSSWRGTDGRLWFSTRTGLLQVEPDKVRANPHPPSVQLERVLVDDRAVAARHAGSPLGGQAGSNVVNLRGAGAPLRLEPGHGKVEIEFAALSFASPENVQFRHRLEGFDAGWVEVGPQRHATYPRLPAGEHEFRVQACNNEGVWNETGATLRFAVTPFFWETWWFRGSIGLGVMLVAGGGAFAVSRRRYREKLRRLEARRVLEQERARIARDIHDDLGASLTRITLLSQSAAAGVEDPEAAAASLTQIHQTARDLTHAMGEVVWAVNPEHDTFDSLANYISHYAQNYLRAAGIRCRIEMPLQLPRQALPADIRHNLFLAAKEALHNVVKHAAASEVRIALSLAGTGFDLLVADNGRGFAPPPAGAVAAPGPRGHGLANMRSRLREIGGECDLRSEPGAGTRLTFRVPLPQPHGHP
ncbi:MAG: hypothetical protein RJA22_118 [Verrucomicrobiota bacterium]|jgi:signal transduction histidine kinase/ligand-binding sensor domain-containing protein